MTRSSSTEIAICHDNAAGHVSYLQGGHKQSMADDRGVSLADYIHAMFSLLLQAGARQVLLIGCGGGTLATMLRRKRAQVTMVDISEASFAIARQHFALPGGVACHVADGRAFLEASARRYDAIVLDAYSRNSIPRQFLSRAFMRLAASRLAPQGILVANVMANGAGDRRVRRLAGLMQIAFNDVRVFAVPGRAHGNVLVMAGAVAGLKKPKLEMPPSVGRTELRRELAAFAFEK
jgi:spermidine synthase